MENKLTIKDLRISFRTNNGRVQAVRGINCSLKKGETLAIVGESGSGKSVTARAMMGILAPNAIVESGEILYDGQDLLRISEEDFHKLRGNKISMIFQDPLSSLNPIVKIGKQLTEAMILNGKANQKDAKRSFELKSKQLIEVLTASKACDEATAKAKVTVLKEFSEEGNRLEKAYNASMEAIEGTLSDLEGIVIDIAGNRPKDAVRDVKEVQELLKKVYNVFLVPESDTKITALAAKLGTAAAKFEQGGNASELSKTVEELKPLLEDVLKKEVPNFFTLGYYEKFCPTKKPLAELAKDIKAMNAMTREYLDKEYMLAFIDAVKKGIKHSAYAHKPMKEQAIKEALELRALVMQDKVSLEEVKKCEKKLIETVNSAIDRLAIAKDSVAYTFEESLKSAVAKYEEARKLESLTKRNKKQEAAWEAVDMPMLVNNIRLVLKRLRQNYEMRLNEMDSVDYEALAVGMIDYLKEQSSKMVYKVTKTMARDRAIKLMEEVGIPEARKRYYQYPFQFSGGMRQRIVIAIALAANPDVLICDEPTTALDVTIQAQILDLINGLKQKRQLTVIFITHDLGVVANMADKIAVMYAGKVVEYGEVDDIFYDPRHPYTWALLSSMPDLFTEEKLEAIPGTPPNMITPPKGDAFAARNKYAMAIDFEEQPPMFQVTETHYAATWLMHPNAPKVDPPKIVTDRIARMKEMFGGE